MDEGKLILYVFLTLLVIGSLCFFYKELTTKEYKETPIKLEMKK